jgi:endoglycosylceramidase
MFDDLPPPPEIKMVRQAITRRKSPTVMAAWTSIRTRERRFRRSSLRLRTSFRAKSWMIFDALWGMPVTTIRTNRRPLRCGLSFAVLLAAAFAASDVLAQGGGDVFSSGSGEGARAGGVARSGGGNTTRRTGKQATQDDSVYCQQTPDGRVIPQPYGGTRRNIPCGPAFSQQPQQSQQAAQQPERSSPRLVNGCAAQLPKASPSGINRLCVEDGHFKDENGRVVILRGVNLAGTSKIPPFLPLPNPNASPRIPMRGDIMLTRDFDFLGNTWLAPLEDLPRWGVNVIRLLFVWEAYEPLEGVTSERYLRMLDAIVERAARLGIYVIVDFHQDVYSRWMAGGCGEGFPQWTQVAPGLDRPRNDESCKDWMNKGLADADMHLNWHQLYNGSTRDSYLRVIEMLVRRYGRRPGVIGFDPLNEPFALITGGFAWGNNWRWDVISRRRIVEHELPAFYEKVAERVNAIGITPSPILFLEPHLFVDLGVDSSLMPPASYNQSVYAPHFYDPDISVLGRFISDERTKGAFDNMANRARSWGTPLFVGEFGAGAHVQFVSQYMDALHTQLNRHFASGAQWSFTPGWTPHAKDGWNGEDLSIVAPGDPDQNGEGYRPKLFRPRPYPQRIDGEPERLEVTSRPGRGYSLSLSFRNAPSSSNATTIYVPQNSQPRWEVRPASAGRCNLERQQDRVQRVVCRLPSYAGVASIIVTGSN